MKEDRLGKILTVGGAILTAVFCLAPIGVMVLTALAGRPDFLRPEVPLAWTVDHLRAVLTSEAIHFPEYLRNSLLVSAASAVVAVFLASLAAYALTRMSLPGRGALLLLILAVSMFPPVSLVGYLYRIMASIGWINTYPALILPYVAWTLPLSVWILVSYFTRIPRDLDRAGLIDGCSRLQILLKIIFPTAAPGIFATLLLAFIFAFNEFLFALMLTTDYSARTVPVGIALFQGLHGQTPWGEIMAAACLTILPVVLLALFFQRRIVQGLTRGAVKE